VSAENVDVIYDTENENNTRSPWKKARVGNLDRRRLRPVEIVRNERKKHAHGPNGWFIYVWCSCIGISRRPFKSAAPVNVNLVGERDKPYD